MAKSTTILCFLVSFTPVLSSLTISTLDVDENYYDVDYDSTQRSRRDVAQNEHIIWRDNRESVKFGTQNGTQTIKRIVHHGIYPSLEMEVPIGANLDKINFGNLDGKRTERLTRSVHQGDQYRTNGGEVDRNPPNYPVRITYQAVYPPLMQNSSGTSPYMRAAHPPNADANYYTRQRVRPPVSAGNRTQYRTLYFPGTGQNYTGDPMNKGRARLVSAAYYNVNGSRDDLRSFSNPPAKLRRVGENVRSNMGESTSSIRRQRAAEMSERAVPAMLTIRRKRDAMRTISERELSPTSSIRNGRDVAQPLSERVEPRRRRDAMRSINKQVAPQTSSIRDQPELERPIRERVVSPMTSIRRRRDMGGLVSKRVVSKMPSIRRRRDTTRPTDERVVALVTPIRRRRNAINRETATVKTPRKIPLDRSETRSVIDAQQLNWMLADQSGAQSRASSHIEASNRALPDVDAPLLNAALSNAATPVRATHDRVPAGLQESDRVFFGIESDQTYDSVLDHASEIDRKKPKYWKRHKAQRWSKSIKPHNRGKAEVVHAESLEENTEVGDRESFESPASKNRKPSKFLRSKKHRKLPKKLQKSGKRRLKKYRKHQNEEHHNEERQNEELAIDIRTPSRQRRDTGSWNWLHGVFGWMDDGTPVVVQKCKNRVQDVDNDIAVDDSSKMEPPIDCFILIQAPPRRIYCKPPRRYAMGRCRPVL